MLIRYVFIGQFWESNIVRSVLEPSGLGQLPQEVTFQTPRGRIQSNLLRFLTLV